MARIAWIDDDHQVMDTMVKLLELDGHTIVTFGSWDEVQKKIETVCKCDAVILDIILPPAENDPYTGLSIAKQLREQRHYQGAIVICSRVQNPKVLDELRELGITRILRKPVRPSELHQAVTVALAENEQGESPE